MGSTIETVPLVEGQIDVAGEVLGRAFFDDPLLGYILPDESQRKRHLGWFMRLGIRYGHSFGEVYTTDGPVKGAAVWLPPGETDMRPERMDQVGMSEAPARLGEEAFGRFLGFMEHLHGFHRENMPQPHFYLMVLGVDPPLQGRGISGTLMQPILDRADGERLPCYLETQQARNVPFYRKHGFAVVAELDSPGAPLTWTMSRPPRRE